MVIATLRTIPVRMIINFILTTTHVFNGIHDAPERERDDSDVPCDSRRTVHQLQSNDVTLSPVHREGEPVAKEPAKRLSAQRHPMHQQGDPVNMNQFDLEGDPVQRIDSDSSDIDDKDEVSGEDDDLKAMISNSFTFSDDLLVFFEDNDHSFNSDSEDGDSIFHE